MRVSRYLDPALVLIAPAVAGREELFQLFGELFRDVGMVADADLVAAQLMEREEILSTGIGGGVAIPHAQVPGVGRLIMAASIHPDGLVYPALDHRPVRLVFCLIGDASTAADHLAGLARLARIARRAEALDELIASSSGRQFIETLERLEGV